MTSHDVPCELVVRMHPRPPVVVVRGELDHRGAPRITPQLLQAAHEAGTDLVVDLAQTSFLGCLGLRTLVAARAVLGERGHGLTVRGATGIVRRILVVAELAELLDSADETGAPTPCEPTARGRPHRLSTPGPPARHDATAASLRTVCGRR